MKEESKKLLRNKLAMAVFAYTRFLENKLFAVGAFNVSFSSFSLRDASASRSE